MVQFPAWSVQVPITRVAKSLPAAILAGGLLATILVVLPPRSAVAGPVLSQAQVRIEGAGGFPGGGFNFPFTLAAPPGETVFDVDTNLTPPGFPVPLYSLAARSEIGVAGNNLVQTSKFSLQCRIPGTGCGSTQLRFVSEGTLDIAAGTELKEVQFVFSDFNYTGSNAPLAITLAVELNLASVAATQDVAVAATKEVVVGHDPFLETIVAFAFSALPEDERRPFRSYLSVMSFVFGNTQDILEGGSYFISENTFEMRLITGPIDAVTPAPAPGTLVLFGIALAGLGWSRRRKLAGRGSVYRRLGTLISVKTSVSDPAM